MATERNVNLYLVHVYLDGSFGWSNDSELNKLIYEHGRIQTVPLGIYEPNAENIHKKLKVINIKLDVIKEVLKNPGKIIINTVDKYEDYDCSDSKYTLCIGLLATKV